ncbi:hypothetical protein ACFOW6_13395 [Fodinicurvata halophila]|uniref:Stability determinant n=1 Tax=Fodinicurvata halophila TaxID=1419723 RepID=A0ABV8UPR3_9PROT
MAHNFLVQSGVDPEQHAAWFRARVHEALQDTRPDLSEEEVQRHFARRRADALRRDEP